MDWSGMVAWPAGRRRTRAAGLVEAFERAPPAAARAVGGRDVTGLLLALVAGVSAGVAAGVALATADDGSETLRRVILHGFIVGAPVGCGLYAIRIRHLAGFGRLLLLVAVLWAVALLSETSASVPYSIGRLAAWIVQPVLLYLILTFPVGRLASSRDRTLFFAATGVVLVLYLGSALLVDAYPQPVPWTTCREDCPPNALQVLDGSSFVDTVVAPLRDLTAALLLLLVTVSLGLRLRRAPAATQITAAPVLAASITATTLLTAFLVARRIDASAVITESLATAWAVCVPVIAGAFLLGLVQRRLYVSNALAGLAGALAVAPAPRGVAVALGQALREPRAAVLVRGRAGTSWHTTDGQAADLAAPPWSGHEVRTFGDDRGPWVAVTLPRDAEVPRELADAAVAMCGATLSEQVLRDELARSLADLDDSRKRIATAADAERRRIERDLHDGAQQRLVALRMKLSLAEDALAEDALADDPAAARRIVHRLGDDVDQALDDVRSLAAGIYPSLLADRGPGDALRSVLRRSPVSATIRATGLTRRPPEIESAVYFTCLEALQNVAKHAPGAAVAVELWEDGALHFKVRDDGPGFDLAAVAPEHGLRNMRDRVESVGGTLLVASEPGTGTVVTGRVPLGDLPAPPVLEELAPRGRPRR